jgi:hypothetical protein
VNSVERWNSLLAELPTASKFSTATPILNLRGLLKPIPKNAATGKASRTSLGSAKKNEEAAIRAALSFLQDLH